jgi:hypothetical protein
MKTAMAAVPRNATLSSLPGMGLMKIWTGRNATAAKAASARIGRPGATACVTQAESPAMPRLAALPVSESPRISTSPLPGWASVQPSA